MWDKTTKLSVKECGICGPKSKIIQTELPYVISYLAAELACMNVKMEFKFNQKDTEKSETIEYDSVNNTEFVEHNKD